MTLKPNKLGDKIIDEKSSKSLYFSRGLIVDKLL